MDLSLSLRIGRPLVAGGGGPRILFEDKFDGDELDPTKWVDGMYWGYDPPRNPGTGEIQTYTPTAISVGGGKLEITSTKSAGTPTANGPYTGGTASDLGGGAAWSNPTNAQSSNNTYATRTQSATGNSNYFYVTGFSGLSAIGDNEVITGVKIEWECLASAANTFRIPESYLMTSSSNPISTTFTSTPPILPTSEGFISGGGSSSLNGASLTPAIVKAAGFGVAFNVEKYAGATSQTASIDSVRMTVYTDSSTYTGGIITTYGLFGHKYGYIEGEFQIPGGGKGHWPAFWLANAENPAVWPPELDIAEWGFNNSIAHVNIHWDDGGHQENPMPVDLSPTDLSADWHKYAMDWQENSVQWFIDDVLVHETTDPDEIPDIEMYLIINYAIGNPGWPAFVGMPDGTSIFPGVLKARNVVWRDRKPD